MRAQPANSMPALGSDSSSMDKLGPIPRHSRGEGTGGNTHTNFHSALYKKTATELTQHFSRG